MFDNFVQSLEYGQGCKTVFYQGKFVKYSEVPAGKYYSWNVIRDSSHEIEYAMFYVDGLHYSEFLFDDDLERYKKNEISKKAFLNAFRVSGLNISKAEYTDLFPESFLNEYFDLINIATEYVFANVKRPDNYDFLVKEYMLIESILYKKLNFDFGDIEADNKKIQKIYNEREKNNFIFYDMFKTNTGRLTVTKGTFPILNLETEYRKILIPNNDLFVEFDYNSAEVRVLNYLSGAVEGNREDDIHAWLATNIFKTDNREEAKRQFFSWIYNPTRENKKLESIYNKKNIYEKYYKQGYICTPFGRCLQADDYHALSYLIQSTASDITIESAININEKLKNTNSYVAFMVHDSIVLDVSRRDLDVLLDLRHIMENTRLGKMKINVSVGNNYGNMRKVK